MFLYRYSSIELAEVILESKLSLNTVDCKVVGTIYYSVRQSTNVRKCRHRDRVNNLQYSQLL